jgi:hypothetical protein
LFVIATEATMLLHRFRELLKGHDSVADATIYAATSFVPCPVVQVMPADQRAWVLEVYRLAAEQTRRQMTPSHVNRVVNFSRN